MANVKSLGLPNKKSSPSNICLKNKNVLLFNSLSIAENLVLKLPKPPNNFGIQSVNIYYKKCNLKEKLLFAKIKSDKAFKILKKLMKVRPQTSIIFRESF